MGEISLKSITDEMHKHHTMFQGAGTYMPRVGTKVIQVQQYLDKYPGGLILLKKR